MSYCCSFYEYQKKYLLDTKIVRIFNTYGPKMDLDDGRVITNFIKSIKENKQITIYGTGQQTRSFCYVDDLVDGMLRMMGTADEVTGPVNVGNPNEFTMLELAELVQKLTGSRSKLVFKPLPQDDPKQRQPNVALASSLLNWAPKTELIEGLTRTIAYFRELKLAA